MKKMTYFPQNADYIENTIVSTSGYNIIQIETSMFFLVYQERRKWYNKPFFEINISSKQLVFSTFGIPESQLQNYSQ